MYAGHLASAMALKAYSPKTPTWALVFGVGLLDILFGPFVLLGIERVSMTPGVSPGFRLDYIDWSHSLVMSLVWSVAFALLFRRRGPAVAIIAGVAVFSHFVLDAVVHPADLALWPGAAQKLGLGLWRTLPIGWWFVELAVIGAFLSYYGHGTRRSTEFGGRSVWVALTIMGLHLLNSPWLSPSA